MKKRIFIANDASFLDTGYGIYGREILSRLHKSNKFEVAELGCYADITHKKISTVPWKFYPNAVTVSDKRYEQYKSNAVNQFGLWRFNRCLADFKPHIVFDIRDYWMFAHQEVSPYRKHFHWVIMPATDSAPPKIDWLYTFANADTVIPYTEWAKKVLTNYCGQSINLFPKIANAGINPNEFYPFSNKSQHKISMLGKDIPIIGVVMRNQKRKLLADIMLAFKKYLEDLKQTNQIELYEKTHLYLHTSYPEDAGWDIPSLLLEYNLLDRTYFTYVCRECNHFFSSKFQDPITTCTNCNKNSATISGPAHGINTEQLNKVYNLFDLFVQFAICEGFGMPQIEAAACGLQIASVDYSAMTEIVEKLDGYKIPVIRMFREMETNADRAYPDIDATVKIMYDHFVNTAAEIKAAKSIQIRQKCIDLFTWDNVYKVWEECFDNINVNSKQPWVAPPSNVNTSIKVPENLDHREFVEFVIGHIINDHNLLDTAAMQCLIRDLHSGLIAKNGSISVLERNHVINMLENHLNNKIACEKMRTEPQNIMKEDFI